MSVPFSLTAPLNVTGALTGAPSNGSLVSVNSSFTDTSTAASSTATANFSGVYLGTPTLNSSNTAVTTTLANTLTIAGPPTAGTNETITNAYALNILSGTSALVNLNINGMITRNVVKEFCARFFLNSNWTPAAAWNYLPAQFSLAADLPPSLNASISGTNVNTAVNLNSSNGLIFLPVAGKWTFNVFAAYVNNVSTPNGYEFRLCVYSAPAWSTAGSAAKSFGTGQSANTLAGVNGAQLATTAFITTNESGLFYSGIFPANTLIALLSYSASGNMNFTSSGLYIEVKMDYALQ